MNVAEDFLQAIIDNPDDDGPRLVYADWLDENEDPRGEFIRVQCELATLPEDDERRDMLTARERRLVGEYGRGWLGRLRPWGCRDSFRRGFPELLSMPADDFLLNPDRIFRQAPIRSIRFYQVARSMPALVDRVQVRRLEGLGFRNLLDMDAAARELANSPHLVSLRALHLEADGYHYLSATGVSELANAPTLKGLRRLNLARTGIGDTGIQLLAGSPHLSGLTELFLDGVGDYADRIHAVGARALAGSNQLTKLTCLSLAENVIGDAGLIDLVGSPNVKNLTALDVSANDIGSIGDAGMRALAASPHLKQLRWLNLAGNPLGVAGARALAEWPGLSRLRRLDLAGCPLGSRGVQTLVGSPRLPGIGEIELRSNQIGDAGVAALAESPFLVRVTRLGLAHNEITERGVEAMAHSYYLNPLAIIDLSENDLFPQQRGCRALAARMQAAVQF